MGVELCMGQITPENLEKLLSSDETKPSKKFQKAHL